MRADDFMRSRLNSARLDDDAAGMDPQPFLTTNQGQVPVYAVRAPQTKDAAGTSVPAIVWRLADLVDAERQALPTPSTLLGAVYDVECHASKHDEAIQLADAAILALRTRGMALLTMFDEPDDPAQKAAEYFSRVFRVAISNA